MKMLVVAPQPFFTPRGTPFSVYHRTRVTAELGVEVDLLTYGEGQDVDLPGVRIVRIPRLRLLEPVRVGPSFGKLLLDVFVVAWTIGLLLRNRYDVVHAHEEAVFFSALLRPLFRFKLVYDMHSSLPQQLTNFGFTKSRLLIGLFERLENTSLRASDHVITISPALAEYAVSVLGSEEKHTLIENSLFDPVHLAEDAERLRREAVDVDVPAGAPVIGYAGTFEAYQGIDLLLEAQTRVRRRVPDAVLLLIGGSGAQVEEYRAMAERLGVASACRFTGFLPQEEARRLLRCAAVVVSPRTRGDNTPLKIYEQLDCGIPLVATRIRSHTQVLDESCCFLADPEPDAFADALVEALTNEARRGEVVAGARELYRRSYSAERYRDKLLAVLERLA